MSGHQARGDRFSELLGQVEELLNQGQADQDAWPKPLFDLIQELKTLQTQRTSQTRKENRVQQDQSGLNQEYADLFEHAPCGYLTLNPEGLITRINRTGERFLGTRRDRLRDHPFNRFVASESQKVYDQTLQRAGQSKSASSRQLKLIRGDGSPLWVQAEIQADQDASEAVTRYRLLLFNRSERIQAKEQTQELQIRLQQARKAESLSRMAGAITHHFNNQLSTILGNLELALEILPGKTGIHENLIQAMQAAWRATEINSLMLTYLGQTKAESKILDLSETCRKALSKLQETLPKEVSLETELAFPGPVVRANMGQLQQVLSYLFSNARESILEDTGSIRLATRVVPASEIPDSHLIPVGWRAAADFYACLEVRDSGRGMTLEEVDKSFDPFFSTKISGRGLGLAVVLGIVKGLNGAIGVRSKPDHGSSFQVYLPLVNEETSRQTGPSKAIHDFQGTGTVLLVEDQDAVRNIVTRILEHLGFQVLSAREGSAAIEIFRNNRETINCVLTDLSMPGMDGWETLSALRKIDPGIPVILASGYDQTRAMAGNHPELPQGFLGKPYQMSELKATLARVLDLQPSQT